MIDTIFVKPEFVDAARARSAAMGSVHNSILKGQGNTCGFIAEEIVAELVGGDIVDTKDFDILTPCGLRIDVKAKQTKFKPEPEYEASIARTSVHQDCDVYCFMRVLYNTSVAYMVGFYPKQKFFEDAVYHKKGDYDPDNDFTFKWSCYNLPHHALMTWEQIEDYFSGTTH